jgi:23S rRNA (guanine2445-N2)-methyltransferase / 23S rRNA (guanine2069-N7)-methyltransferase
VVYRACLWSRLANRILWPVATVDARDADHLYRDLQQVDWGKLFDERQSIAIDFSGENREIRNTQFGAQRTKDAVVDWFARERGNRPQVDRRQPRVRLNVRLVRDRAHVSIDFSGSSLHRRGYRLDPGAAPLKENLAAAILLRADWPEVAARGGALIDPMCGSATLLLEGAMLAADMAPGLGREGFGFEYLQFHDPRQWQAILADARGRAERGRAATLPEIRGYDASPGVIRRAQENIARLGLEKVVRVSCKPLRALKKPTHRPIPLGLVVCNPPYGERLGERDHLAPLYRELGEAILREFAGWRAAILTPDLALGRAIGLRSHKRYKLYNGALEVQLLLFDLADNELRDMGHVEPAQAAAAPLSEGAQMFANRLRKNRKRLSSWVKREQVQCYRLYDADMPEYAVAVDIYGDQVHVAEYKAPARVSAEAALGRLEEVRAAVPVALGIAPDAIAFKQRSRQRGSGQYEKQDHRAEFLEVREGPARLLVNLHDYLDTGLFLDHRPLRRRIAAEARGRDFLNLFCYTGSATIHAALGGARRTTSVDASNTYLEWLRRNLALNGKDGPDHRLIRADCRAWLERAEGEYDLILLDPPSFSNSKSARDSFDVQRDHPQLLRLAMGRLRPGGRLYFSNNLRSFTLDETLPGEFRCEDITAGTLDPDFQRNRRVHCCGVIERRAGAGNHSGNQDRNGP